MPEKNSLTHSVPTIHVRSPNLRPLCSALLLALGLQFWGSANAASPLQQRIHLEIPNGISLEEALVRWGIESRTQVMMSTDLVKDRRVQQLHGDTTAEAALSALLDGSGLSYTIDGNTVRIVSASASVRSTLMTGGPSAPEQGGQPPIAESTRTPASASRDELQEVVVTAQKREEHLENVPISISVLGGTALDSSTTQGVSEALNTVPGVATSQNYLGGGTTVVIRGVQAASPLFTGSSPVAYYLDSVPFGLIRSAVAPDEDAYDLERVEVLRGPQGTLYGASALNGVVRVLSNDPAMNEFDLKARISDSGTEYGGNNYRGDLAVNVPILDNVLAARAVLGYESDSGWIDQPNKKDVNDGEMTNYRLKLKAQPTDTLSIVLSGWSSHQNFGAPSVGYTYNSSSSLLNQPLSTDFDAYGITLDDTFSWFSVSSKTSYLDYKNVANLDLLPFGIPGSIFFSGLASNVFSQELNLTSSQTSDWRWSAGAIYTRSTENNLQYYTNLDVNPETVDMVSKSYAAFGELTRLLFDGKLELTAGMRHYHDDVFQLGQLVPGTPFTPESGTFEANTPRAVVTWHALDTSMFYASYSQGFRSGFPQDPSVPAGFPPVQPDRLRNYELGSKGSLLDGTISFDTSIYYMDWEAIQQLLLVPYEGIPDGAGAIVNSQAASGVGIDLALSARPSENLQLTAAVSWNNLEMSSNVISGGVLLFSKGDRPNYSPETTASGSAEYHFPLGHSGYKGAVNASISYISQQDYHVLINGGSSSQVAITQPGDPMTIGRLSFTVFAPTNWTAALFIDNVNNWRGTPIQPFGQVSDWDPRVRPRTAGLQFEYHLH